MDRSIKNCFVSFRIVEKTFFLTFVRFYSSSEFWQSSLFLVFVSVPIERGHVKGGGSEFAEGDAVQMPKPLGGAQGPQALLRAADGGGQQLMAPLQLALYDGVVELDPATL